jgi:hypothetical protein
MVSQAMLLPSTKLACLTNKKSCLPLHNNGRDGTAEWGWGPTVGLLVFLDLVSVCLRSPRSSRILSCFIETFMAAAAGAHISISRSA